MKEITFLNTLNKANLHENIRVKGAEKQAVSCHNRPEKRVVSLRNSPFTSPLELCHVVITDSGVPRVRGGNPCKAAHGKL